MSKKNIDIKQECNFSFDKSKLLHIKGGKIFADKADSVIPIYNKKNKIMDYKELHNLANKFNEALKLYVIERNEVNSTYYVAKFFLIELIVKSHKNIEIRNEFGKWLKRGSTIELKKLLRITSYNDSNAHFNAMALIDAVSGKI